jgi:hypothetical protein
MIDTGLKSAVLSDDAFRRLMLGRQWGPDPRKMALWIGLNPSTADADKDDPTVRRVYGFSKAAGFDHFVLVNLFAHRTAKPKVLWKDATQMDVVGVGNDCWIEFLASQAQMVICAWGANAKHSEARPRVCEVIDLLHPIVDLHVMRLTESSGVPEHPLMLPSGLLPKLWMAKKTA